MRVLLRIGIFLALIAFCQPLFVQMKIPGEENPELIEIQEWINSANSFFSAGDFDSAIIVAEKVLEQIEEKSNESDSLYARVLMRMGVFYSGKGDFNRAVEYYKQSLETMKRDTWSNQWEEAYVLRRLGTSYRILCRYAEAESCIKQALRVLEDISESAGGIRALCLSELGVVCMSQLRYAEAESLYKQALKFCIEQLGYENKHTADILNHLASLYFDQGRYDEAELLYKRGLRIRRKILGPDHSVLSESLNNLGTIFEIKGRYAEAESCYLEALKLREESPAYGPHHPYLAYYLNNLGELYASQGNYAKAESICNRAVEIVENAYGPHHLHVAWSLDILGDIYRWQGEYPKAEQFYTRALTINRKLFSSVHPEVANSLRKLALLHGSKGEYSKSLANYEELLDSKQAFVENAFAYASEEQKLRYADMYPLVDPSLLSLAQIDASERSKIIALEMILRGKALVIDAVSAEREIAFCVDDHNILQIEERLREVASQISSWSLASVKEPLSEEYRDSLQVLHVIRDSLETELSRSCSEFREELGARRFKLADVVNALPEEGVLLEFVQYEPYDFGKTGNDVKNPGPPRYLAFTLDHAGSMTLTDLGDAQAIDSLVGLARRQIDRARKDAYSPLIDESERRLSAITEKLYNIIFASLESYLDDRTDIFISPDGQLNLLPFEILPCPDGKYAIERFRMSYLSSGRDLLRFKKQYQSSDWALAMADPDFDLSVDVLSQQKEKIPDKSVIPSIHYEPYRGVSGCFNNRFNSLPYGREETKSIAKTLRKKGKLDVAVYYGGDALEEVLKQMPTTPRVLHLDTHGLFCGDTDFVGDEILENPLLRSGLAFAGANRLMDKNRKLDSQTEDGILTAVEASRLNLFGTELVTLSACETGVGEVKNGEGVYGLRRAFQHAGARTIVMSLWKVPDKETCELMDNFYKSWLSGQSKREALRRSALKIINDHRAKGESTHPLFWGGFVVLGDPD